MSKQYSTPYVIADGNTSKLEPIQGKFNEDWLQNFVFNCYQSIPINQIEPVFSDLIPVCRELSTNAGPIDILFVNKDGLLTLVECKLWKNPQARREVVGQILDYAKEISQWTYDELENRVARALKRSDFSLFDLVKSEDDELYEQEFIDNVSRNMRKGRFLLLILGDGIRENVEQIADFLQKHAHLNFSFALVEYGIYKIPNSPSEEYYIQPRILAQTMEVERYVIRIDSHGRAEIAPAELPAIQATASRRVKISELEFFDKLEAEEPLKDALRTLFQKTDGLGLYLDPGQNSMIVKSKLFNYNFGIFRTDGQFSNAGIASQTQEIGHPEIGESYLDKLAKLFINGTVKKSQNRFDWKVKIMENGKERFVRLPEIIAVQTQWLELIQDTLNQLSEVA